MLVISDAATQLDCSTECVDKLSCSHAIVFVVCLSVVLYNLLQTAADINLNKTHSNPFLKRPNTSKRNVFAYRRPTQ